MALTIGKCLALLLGIGYSIAAFALAPSDALAFILAATALAPVALIWFPEFFGGTWIHRKKTVLGTYDDPTTPLQRPTRDSPPFLVSFMGWFFLVGLPPLIYWLASR